MLIRANSIGRPESQLALGFSDYIAEDLNDVRHGCTIFWM